METQRLSVLLRLIAQSERMAILMLLLDSERSLDELAQLTGLPATTVSNHLARLRSENVVDFTRYLRISEYRLTSTEAAAILQTLRRLQNGETEE